MTTFILFAVVSTILLPILSGSVVLVQRRADTIDTDYNTDYENAVANDNIDLAGGYYNSYQEDPYNTAPEDPYNTNTNYYDPYYGYNYPGKYFIFNFFLHFFPKGSLENIYIFPSKRHLHVNLALFRQFLKNSEI